MNRPWLGLVAGAVILAGGLPAFAAPNVVVSIKPIHALIADVMEGVATPTLLLPGATSPHVYTLRPSDGRALANADLVFWIGPDLETFLAKPIASIARRAKVVTLAREADLALLPAREAGLEGQAAGLAVMDMHLWLDPENARRIVAFATSVLATADPANGARYAANRDRTVARLDALDRELDGVLAPAKGTPFFALHDGFQYLEHRFSLTEAGTVSVSSDRMPGARMLLDVRAAIRNAGIGCVVGEPQFSAALARTLVEGTGARIVILDPLGAAEREGPGAYDQIMRRVARAMRDCLSPKG